MREERAVLTWDKIKGKNTHHVLNISSVVCLILSTQNSTRTHKIGTSTLKL
jgi:hypothetical protein